MNTLQTPNAAIEEGLLWRYATKRFDPHRTISPQDWHTLEEALHKAPSSFGLQPWHFVIVKDPAIRLALQPHSWNQSQVVEASHLVVFAARQSIEVSDVDAHMNNIIATRSVKAESLAFYRDKILQFTAQLQDTGDVEHWTTRQVYLALGMLLSTAAQLRIDTCPLEGIEPQSYDEILKLPAQGYTTKVACALGYRASDDQYALAAKVRFPKECVFSIR